jgi:hypothetical protein
MEGAMRIGWMLGIMLAVGGIASAAQAQETNDHNIPTETQSRLQSGAGDLDWLNLIGLFGLVGLAGLKKEHSDDSYHPTSVE